MRLLAFGSLTLVSVHRADEVDKRFGMQGLPPRSRLIRWAVSTPNVKRRRVSIVQKKRRMR